MRSAERINPDRQDTKPFALQTTADYRFIRDRVTGLNVAHIGCGSGNGSAILAEGAQHVTGVDRSAEAISWAEVRYGNSILTSLCAQAMDLPSQGMRFQALVIPHFLEHVIDQHDLIRLLKQMPVLPGFLCVATPIGLASLMDNPYHYQELTHAELEEMLTAEFSHVDTYSLVMSERLQSYREIRRRAVRRLYALDPLRLRYRVPRRVHQVLFDLAALIGNRVIARAADQQGFELTLDDYTVVEGKNPECLDLVAVAHL